jgi:hypothetical protein
MPSMPSSTTTALKKARFVSEMSALGELVFARIVGSCPGANGTNLRGDAEDIAGRVEV